ncbi:MAG: glycosyltransferase [Anaerolineales bacterium]|nr:glycosyltransferase [Anaerolineales bacterium]
MSTRFGQNPAKSMPDVAQPAEVTVAVVVYIPFTGGYYAESLDVLKLCLESIVANTQYPYDLMVFDNASCAEVREYLLEMHQAGKIQYLVFSEQNVGKAGAWNYVFGAAPGKYVAYADSDVYHYPGWLQPQIEVLEQLPQAGMVTGLPMLTPEEYSSATVAWAEDNPDVTLERGRFLPWEDFWRHAVSLGGDEERARQFYEANQDICVVYQGERYYVGASHFQFVGRKRIFQSVLPIPSQRPMGQVRLLDEAINAKGYLRLCTSEWYNQHMGNTVPPQEFFAHPVEGVRQQPVQASAGKGLWAFKPLRRLLQWVYNRSFEILYRSE